MYSHGALDLSYLRRDYRAITDAIGKYEPDLLIEISRPAAAAAAMETGVPLFSVISAPEHRGFTFSASVMNGMNQFLSEHHIPQVLRLHEVTASSTLRIAFGPAQFQPFPETSGIVRFGMSAIAPLPRKSGNRLSIVISESSLSSASLKKTICDAFSGAPYEVMASIPKTRAGRSRNIRFQSRILLSTINGSRACIHDGTDAITQYCIALGIPQIVIHDNTYMRQWNAVKVRHTGAGLAIPESGLTMERLYETYRTLCADDSFFLAAAQLRREADLDGDLSGLLDFIP